MARIWDPLFWGGGSNHRCHLRGLPVEEVLAPSLHSAGWGLWSWTTSRLTREKGSERTGRAAGGCKLLCTCRPTLSSELNPIEEAFSKMKGILSARSGARSWEVLIAALGRALDEITPGMLGGFSSTADSESMGSTVVISAIGVLECSTRTAQPYSGEPIRLWILGLIALILG